MKVFATPLKEQEEKNTLLIKKSGGFLLIFPFCKANFCQQDFNIFFCEKPAGDSFLFKSAEVWTGANGQTHAAKISFLFPTILDSCTAESERYI